MSRSKGASPILVLSLLIASPGCGSGSSSAPTQSQTGDGGAGNGGSGNGGSGTVTGSGGGNASCEAGGATSAGAAEGEWAGMVPIFGGVDAVRISGTVVADGSAYFVVAGEIEAGSLLAESQGVAKTCLVRYGAINGVLGGSAVPGRDLNIDFATAHTSLSGHYKNIFVWPDSIILNYQSSYDLPAALASLSGVYTVTEDTTYVLTLSVNGDGQISGSDTKGCVLVGDATVPDPTRNIYQAEVDVSSCAALNGHYAGILSLRGGAALNDELSLALRSVSPVAGQNAIFHSLYR